jgi:NAD(P)H-nitrite reductase large subunit
MAIAISLVWGEGKRGPGENWVRFAKGASAFILFGLGSKLGSFRKSLSRPLQMSESSAGCEREVRGAGGRELGSFRKSASGFISFGLGPELGSFRKHRSRACRVFENGTGSKTA